MGNTLFQKEIIFEIFEIPEILKKNPEDKEKIEVNYFIFLQNIYLFLIYEF
jgi:hypothetical protein